MSTVAAPEDLRLGDLAVWRFDPPAAASRSVVVMAHGFSMTRRDGLAAYATALAEAGHTVLCFDHRHLGESGGEHRQRFRIAEQLEDWHRVIEHARTLEAGPLVLWGFSFSGGHAVRLAVDTDAAAILVLCPFLDGLARAVKTPPKVTAWIVPRALADVAGRHTTIPVTAPPGGLAAMPFPGEHDGFMAARHEGSRWVNRISPGLFLTIATHRPVTLAPQVGCPAWVGLGERDVSVSARAVRTFADRAVRGELHAYDCDHFEPFYDEALVARIAGDQVAFLDRVLPALGAPDGGGD